jgi:chemotaxis signal transduction protein
MTSDLRPTIHTESTPREFHPMIATAPTREPYSPAPTRSDTTELVRVEIGGSGFALPLAAIATILSPSAMAANDDPIWAGSVTSRNGEIPIADARAIFGLSAPSSDDPRLLILRGSPPTGLLVDAIHGTATVPAGDIEWLSPLFGPVERLLTRAIAWTSDGSLDLLIDIPALRQHLHTGESDTTSAATAVIATSFEQPPTGDRLEVALDNSDRRWLIPIGWVRHISAPRPPAHLPRTSPAIKGFLSWRREPLPLIDTARALGLPPTAPTTQIVLGPAQQPDSALLALTVTSVLGVAAPNSDATPLDIAELVQQLA